MPTRRALLGGVAAASTTVAGCSNPFGERQYYRDFNYEADVSPTDPITDATFYLPVPIAGDDVMISDRLYDGIVPEEWSLDIVETDRGPMLEVIADELPVQNHTYNISIHWIVDEEIDTRNALENEAALQPKEDIEQVECNFPHPDDWEERLRCYSYTGRFFGEYEPAGTDVSVAARFSGENSWHNGGWRGNNYDDTVHGFVDGSGWVNGRGSFREGVGTY